MGYIIPVLYTGLRHDQVGLEVNTRLQCRRQKRCWFDSWLGKSPCRIAWQPIPVFMPGESHGQGNLAGYSPWGCRESDMTSCLVHMHRNTVNINFLLYSLPMFCILPVTLEVFTIKIPSTNLTGLRSNGTERFCVLTRRTAPHSLPS